MSPPELERLLGAVAAGVVSPAAALERLRRFPVDDLQFAQVDHLRPLTQGQAEVVLALGKSPEQVVGICHSLAEARGAFLVTRAEPAVQDALQQRFPRAEVNVLGRTVVLAPDGPRAPTGRGTILRKPRSRRVRWAIGWPGSRTSGWREFTACCARRTSCTRRRWSSWWRAWMGHWRA
jgi:hypothetical protein